MYNTFFQKIKHYSTNQKIKWQIIQIYYQKHKILIWSIAIMLLLFLFHHIYLLWKAQRPLKIQPVSVYATLVKTKDMYVPFKTIGTVIAAQSVSIKSQVDGQIMTIAFNRGEIVKVGQLLYIIDPRPAQMQLQQLEAALAKDQAQLKNTQLIADRDKHLLKKSYVSQAGYDLDQTNVAIQAAAVQADKAAIANAQLQLDYSYIHAPFSGRIGDILVTKGNLIKTAQYTTLTTINQLQPIDIAFSIPQQYFSILSSSTQKSIIVSATIDKTDVEKGYLSFIDNQINSNTGTLNLKATFTNDTLKLLPGQFVEISLPTKTFKKALVVPSSTVQQGPDGSYVFTIKSDATVSYRLVNAGPTVGDDTIILSGLQSGEKVITAGQLQLKEGSSVYIAPPPQPTLKVNPSTP